MIVRVKFTENFIMMFGDSYKPWYMQFDEYFWSHKEILGYPLKVEVSKSKWIGWGGLKWCPEELFQGQLNREGCQENEPDNPNSRKYENMLFYESDKINKKVKEIIKEAKRSVKI